jgi:hypothetical protein
MKICHEYANILRGIYRGDSREFPPARMLRIKSGRSSSLIFLRPGIPTNLGNASRKGISNEYN